MMLDVNFDFTSDTPGYWDGYWQRADGMGGCGKYDPDYESETLLDYSRKLWSRQLPDGEDMQLLRPPYKKYFVWKDFCFSCDSITASFRYIKNREMIDQVFRALPDYRKYFEDFTRRSYTIPGEIIFPMHVNSINQRRGMSTKIRDRWDLTLECIRRYYDGLESPLKKYLDNDRAFFDLFVDFKGYVDYFFLNDCVSDDYEKVIMWTDQADFMENALPKTIEEYFTFMRRQDEFLEKRRERMREFIASCETW